MPESDCAPAGVRSGQRLVGGDGVEWPSPLAGLLDRNTIDSCAYHVAVFVQLNEYVIIGRCKLFRFVHVAAIMHILRPSSLLSFLFLSPDWQMLSRNLYARNSLSRCLWLNGVAQGPVPRSLFPHNPSETTHGWNQPLHSLAHSNVPVAFWYLSTDTLISYSSSPCNVTNHRFEF